MKDERFKWRLCAYGKIIRGDEKTSEDQVAVAKSEEIAQEIVARWNAFVETVEYPSKISEHEHRHNDCSGETTAPK